MTELVIEQAALKLREIFDRAENIWVTPHESPDGDSIGAALALQGVLTRQGKIVHAIRQHPFPRQYNELAGADQMLDVKDLSAAAVPDVIVAVDIASFARIGDVLQYIQKDTTVVNIDHHLGNQGPQRPCNNMVDFVDSRFSSTTMMVYELLKFAYPGAISADDATNCYVGLITDTGCFRHSNTTKETFRVAMELTSLGADPGGLAEQYMFRRRPQGLKLLSQVLSSIEFHDEWRIASVELTQEMLATSGGRMDETEGFVNYASSLDGVQVAVLLREVDSMQTRLSLRSTGFIDVSAVARELGGGGHRNAAGLTLHHPVNEAKRVIVEALSKILPTTETMPRGASSA